MMGCRYLLLGASSEVSLAFLRSSDWQADDEIVAQYCTNKEVLEGTCRELPAKTRLLQADFLSEESTATFAESLEEVGFVPTHILHTPAFPIVNNRFTELSWGDAEKQVHIQCRSLYVTLQSVIRAMAKAKRGKIVLLLSSCTVNVPPTFLSAYVMAKYMLLGMGKALAAEYAAKNIQVNMVSPSMMETKFVAGLYDAVVEQSARKNPMKRNAVPEDVAQTVQWLFSEENGFVTGVNIPVTGGESF